MEPRQILMLQIMSIVTISVCSHLFLERVHYSYPPSLDNLNLNGLGLFVMTQELHTNSRLVQLAQFGCDRY